ncbi:4Fe-4S dicluster domain-containing protein [Chloroflexota bacterium]
MSSKILVCDQAKCSGCRSCEIWCGFHHFQVCNPALGRLKITPYEDKGEFVPVACNHCTEPWCVNECPADAISRDEETGAVVIEEELCTGCLACVDACPFGVIRIGPDGGVFKCDLCGGSPVCVWSCTRGAITYAEASQEYLDKLTSQAGRTGGKV